MCKVNAIDVINKAKIDDAVGIKLDIIADVEDYHMGIVEVAPGKKNRAHYHTKYSELYHVLKGEGTIVLEELNKPETRKEVKVGNDDVVKTPPYTVHQIINTGDRPLIMIFVCNKDSTVLDRHVV